MIIEFRVQNFRSFRKEQTLNLVASNYDKSLPENIIQSVPGLPETRLLKAAALYGPNAGGKTNLLLALRKLWWLVVCSATEQAPTDPLDIEPFCLDRESAARPTTFELTFLVKDIRYELAVAVTNDRVVQERLVAYPNGDNGASGRPQTWFDRHWNEATGQYDWSREQPEEFKRDAGIVQKTRGNALFLSTAAQWNNPQVTPIYEWFSGEFRFLNWDKTKPRVSTLRLLNSSAEARRLMTSVLRAADLGLTDIKLLKEQSNFDPREWPFNHFPKAAEDDWRVAFQHQGLGNESFPIAEELESAGTRHFFHLLGPWFHLMAASQVLVVDELETSLHPTLATELLRLWFKLTARQPRSQLLFTTHNPLLLDMTLLRRDQVWFADKNEEGESFLYPLTDYKPRADESLLRGYLSGRYGAVPFIPSGLVDSVAEPSLLEEAVHGR